MAGTSASKLALARAVGTISRQRGGGGTSAPGKLLMRLSPTAIGDLGARLQRGSVLISATNGKTTTAAMAASILEQAGVPLVYNRAGANMAGGIATTLLSAARPHGGMSGELGLFEVDELWLAGVAAQLHPRVVLLGNLFRDQLDRYGELDAIAESWEHALGDGGAPSPPGAGSMDGERPRLILNADDPLIADLGRERPGVLYFGVDDDSLALAGMAHAADAKHCRRCGAPYAFAAVYLGHLGRYRCPSCGRQRPEPAVIARDVTLEGVRGARFTLRTPAGEAQVALKLPGLYNVYNALAAAALASALEVGLDSIVAGLQGTEAAFGRAETVTVAVGEARRELQILLVKNPAGANEVLRTLALEPGEHDLLAVLNDNIADGRDVSWIWDADFELLAGRVRRATCSGSRAPELAVRLKYAGIDPGRISVQPDLGLALAQSAADRPGSDTPLYALPTYTAMLALRELLVARGEARERMVVTSAAVIWHDLECGAYVADLPLWRELAMRSAAGGEPARILDVGAGTGRVALDLAHAGHRVTALDLDAELLAALRERVAEQDVETLCADARTFDLGGEPFDLCLMPMQTVQLLGGSVARVEFLRRARAHLRPGGLLAAAIITAVEPFDRAHGDPSPSPELARVNDAIYETRAVRVSVLEESVLIERERRIHGHGEPERDVIQLDRVTAHELEREATGAGLRPERARELLPTRDHVGSTVVMLRA